MPLFQKSVVKKYLNDLNKEQLQTAWQHFQNHFHNAAIQQNILNAKEEEYQEGFVRDLFVHILGYTLKPQPSYNLVMEQKSTSDATKSDGAILSAEGAVVAVIELKDTSTANLDKVEKQAFGYKHQHKDCRYVITANFEQLRLYINDAIGYEAFDLFKLSKESFALLYCCLQQTALHNDVPLKMKQQSLAAEENITKKLYADYSRFKKQLFANITAQNPQYNQLELFKKTQKLLDRFLFILFAEDRLLLPPNSIREILQQWEQLKELDQYVPLYDRFKKYFGYMNTGYVGKQYEIFAYNGGLFVPDDILDNIIVEDQLLYDSCKGLSNYDFESEVDVNILGHIFEHSLGEIEEVERELNAPLSPGEGLGVRSTSKRKKDGVFYTPRYITKYIVENTVGELCTQKKTELNIVDDEFTPQKRKANTQQLLQKLEAYRQWLLQLTICDPACGSGAFLNQALEFLISEHQSIDALTSKLFGAPMILSDIETGILENNLYGVDINDEATEIAKLSLWLRTARKGRKLNSLNRHIKCGNSLIDDPAVAGDKAFNWQQEFPEVFAKGGFDVVIGNPPYGAKLSISHIEYFRKFYDVVVGHSEAYYLFVEMSYKILSEKGKMGLIIPNAWFSNKYAMGLRKFILDKLKIETLINFNKKIIFEEADVETSIIITTKTNPILYNCFVGSNIDSEFSFNYQSWTLNEKNIISFTDDKNINSIVSKIRASELTLDNVLDISNGIKPYQVGYGINLDGNPLTIDDVTNKIYHKSYKIDDSYKKEIKGKGISRYKFQWEESYVKWGTWLMSPKAIKYHESPKILVRQIISDYFLATIDLENFYADQSVYVCINYPGGNTNNLMYYLSLINSKLYGFYFRKFYSEEDDLFPKVKVNELKSLPIIQTTAEQQLPFISKADIMLSKNKELQQLKQQLLQLLQSKYESVTLSKKLQDWPTLSFKEFLKELDKQKIKLSLPQQAEWMHYFEAEKAKANTIQQLITKTDKAIDDMVYELYGLTEEERKIVEEG